MSQQLISLSSDLCRLRDDGFILEVRGSYLLVKDVPYVNADRKVKYGILVSDLTLAGDVTTTPETHVAFFVGEHPCNKDGTEMLKIKHQSKNTSLGPDLVANHSFSSKPKAGYPDYYEKMRTYYNIISGPARAIEPTVTVATPLVVTTHEDESVFQYVDTASSRAKITTITEKLKIGPVAIVGLGGTGSYVLDLVAKTPVQEIHLFDGDNYLQHNAFRSPGAASIDELREKPTKVEFFHRIYSKIHRFIFAHPEYINDGNIDKLTSMAFVFVCLDKGEPRHLIVKALHEAGVPFIDVGMGVELVDESLLGVLRVTASTPRMMEHVARKVPFSAFNEANEYSSNIQIADLNALNAALAVIKWKKLFGFYLDLEAEYSSTYTIDGNKLINEDQNDGFETRVRRVYPR